MLFKFVEKQSRIKNKPSFMCNSPLISTSKITNPKNRIVNKLDYVLTRTRKFMWMTQYQVISKTCVLFIDPVIPLNSVEHLLQKPLDQRRTFLREINICFECSRKNNKQYKCHLIWNVWSEEVHIIQHIGFEKKVSVDEMCRFLSFLEAWRRRGYKIKRMRKKELKITQVCGDSLNFKENLVQKLYLLMCIRKISETNAGVCSG